jgi:hypothetical protein
METTLHNSSNEEDYPAARQAAHNNVNKADKFKEAGEGKILQNNTTNSVNSLVGNSQNGGGASGGVLGMSSRIGSVAQFKNSKLFQKFIKKEQANVTGSITSPEFGNNQHFKIGQSELSDGSPK